MWWRKITKHLNSKGIKTYSQGQHTGLCKFSYVVIIEDGGDAFLGQNKVGYSLIDIAIYHPLTSYSTLDEFRKKVKEAMAELCDLRKTGLESRVLVETDKQAYTTSVQYQILKRL